MSLFVLGIIKASVILLLLPEHSLGYNNCIIKGRFSLTILLKYHLCFAAYQNKIDRNLHQRAPTLAKAHVIPPRARLARAHLLRPSAPSAACALSLAPPVSLSQLMNYLLPYVVSQY